MLFMTRKRFEEEVWRRTQEEDFKREMRTDISKLYNKYYNLEKEINELKTVLESGGPAKEYTCDDEFFVTPPVRPK